MTRAGRREGSSGRRPRPPAGRLVNQGRIQRVAAAMLQFGLLGQQYAAEVEQGTLVGSMVGLAS
jgi:hypothetical protein